MICVIDPFCSDCFCFICLFFSFSSWFQNEVEAFAASQIWNPKTFNYNNVNKTFIVQMFSFSHVKPLMSCGEGNLIQAAFQGLNSMKENWRKLKFWCFSFLKTLICDNKQTCSSFRKQLIWFSNKDLTFKVTAGSRGVTEKL